MRYEQLCFPLSKHLNEYMIEAKIETSKYTDNELLSWAAHITSEIRIDEDVKNAYNDLVQEWGIIEKDLNDSKITKAESIEKIIEIEDRIKTLFALEHDEDNPDKKEIDGYKAIMLTIDNIKRELI